MASVRECRQDTTLAQAPLWQVRELRGNARGADVVVECRRSGVRSSSARTGHDVGSMSGGGRGGVVEGLGALLKAGGVGGRSEESRIGYAAR